MTEKVASALKKIAVTPANVGYNLKTLAGLASDPHAIAAITKDVAASPTARAYGARNVARVGKAFQNPGELVAGAVDKLYRRLGRPVPNESAAGAK